MDTLGVPPILGKPQMTLSLKWSINVNKFLDVWFLYQIFFWMVAVQFWPPQYQVGPVRTSHPIFGMIIPVMKNKNNWILELEA